MVDRSREPTLQDTNDSRKWTGNSTTHIKTELTATVANNIIQIIVSLLAALIMLTLPNKMPTWAPYTISPAMLFIVLGARQYLKNFWTPTQDSRGKDVGAKVTLPNMEDYNLAVQKTEDLLEVLKYLEYSWLITMVVGGVVGRA